MEFAGQVAVVTGAARGIGRACCEALLQRGAQVAGVDLRPAAGAAQGGYRHFIGDVSVEAQAQRLFAEVAQAYGRLDVLIHCAGVLEPVCRTTEQAGSDWERVMAVNAGGTFLCCREAGRAMVAQRRGAIVTIGSAAGLVAIPGSNAYGPSKAAVAHMTRSLAGEWARFNVRVNCLAPGYIDAPMADELFGGDSQAREAALRRVPMARLGTAQEVAQVALFLASPLASFVTGAVIPVDGGWSATAGAR